MWRRSSYTVDVVFGSSVARFVLSALSAEVCTGRYLVDGRFSCAN